MRSIPPASIALVLAVAACSGASEPTPENTMQANVPSQPAPTAAPSNEAIPTTNATQSGPAEASLPEPTASPTSAQGAATVVETYYALIEAGKYRDAFALREHTDTMTPAQFAAGFAQYAEYHATVGAPSEIQGAAGSLYVEVPVQLYGRMKDGKPFGAAGTITLRRVNDVPGSTAEQRRWRIYSN